MDVDPFVLLKCHQVKTRNFNAQKGYRDGSEYYYYNYKYNNMTIRFSFFILKR